MRWRTPYDVSGKDETDGSGDKRRAASAIPCHSKNADQESRALQTVDDYSSRLEDQYDAKREEGRKHVGPRRLPDNVGREPRCDTYRHSRYIYTLAARSRKIYLTAGGATS
jgi:hypothetical protein